MILKVCFSRRKGFAVKPFSTKSDVYNWTVPKSKNNGVLRLRGGAGSPSHRSPSPGSPSPSPPPTRPASPLPETIPAASESKDPKPSAAVSTVRPVRPPAPATGRSRSNLRRNESVERRHTVPTARDSPRSRREQWEAAAKSKIPSKQAAISKDQSVFICSNNCGKDFKADRNRIEHENFYCPLRNQNQQVCHPFGFIAVQYSYFFCLGQSWTIQHSLS